jgi:anion-transporting  ArsA/GET3 family ATPase
MVVAVSPTPDMYEGLAEREIRKAMEQGEFDHLPGAGKPIPGLDRPYDPDWWARRYLERLRRQDAAHQSLREVEAELGRLWALANEDEVRRRVGELNRRLEEVNTVLQPAERVEPFDPEGVVAMWRRMRRLRR